MLHKTVRAPWGRINFALLACADIGTPPKSKISHQTMKWGGLLKHRGGPLAGGADGGFMYCAKKVNFGGKFPTTEIIKKTYVAIAADA